LDFCRLRANGGAEALAVTIRTDLRHQRSDTAELLACDQISNETKLLYLRLQGLAAAGEISPSDESGTDNAISEPVGQFGAASIGWRFTIALEP